MANIIRATKSGSLHPQDVIKLINDMELEKKTIDFKNPNHPLTKEFLQKVMAFQEIMEMLIREFKIEQAFLFQLKENEKEMRLAEARTKAEQDAKAFLESLMMEEMRKAKLAERPSERLTAVEQALMQEMLKLVTEKNALQKKANQLQHVYQQAQIHANKVVNQVVVNWQGRHQKAVKHNMKKYVQGVQAFNVIKQHHMPQVQACHQHKQNVVVIKKKVADVNQQIIHLKRKIQLNENYLDDKRDELSGKKRILGELQKQLADLKAANPRDEKAIAGLRDGIQSLHESIVELKAIVRHIEEKLVPMIKADQEELQKLLEEQKKQDEALKAEKAEVRRLAGDNGKFDEDKHIVKGADGKEIAVEELKSMVEEVVGVKPTFAQAAAAAVAFVKDMPAVTPPEAAKQLADTAANLKGTVASASIIPVLQPDVNAMIMRELVPAAPATPTAATHEKAVAGAGISAAAAAARTAADHQLRVAKSIVHKNMMAAEIKLLAKLRPRVEASPAAADENNTERLFAGFALNKVGSGAAAVAVLKGCCDQTRNNDVAGVDAILGAKKTEFVAKQEYDEVAAQLTYVDERLNALQEKHNQLKQQLPGQASQTVEAGRPAPKAAG